MKKTLIILFLFQGFICNGQSGFSFLIGANLHSVSPINDYLGSSHFYLTVTPEIGISYKPNKYPFSLSYRKNINYGIEANKDLYFASRNSVSDFEEMDYFDLKYHFSTKEQSHQIGIGYFHKKWITPPFFASRDPDIKFNNVGSNFEYKGLSLSYCLEMSGFNFELKKLIELKPSFGLLEKYLYTLSIYKDISFINHVKKNKISSFWSNFHPNLSMRVGMNKYHYKINKYLYNAVTFYPGIGLEYHVPKYDIVLSASRNVWKRLTGGLISNDLIGYISISNFYLSKKVKNKMMLGIGFSLIKNTNEKERAIPMIIIDDNGNATTVYKIHATNIKGMGLKIGYILNNNYLIEFQQTFPYLGDSVINPWNTSIGLKYIIIKKDN